MDYGDGQELKKYQWDYVHDPEGVVGWFEEDEEGALIVDNPLITEAYWADANGKRILALPYGQKINIVVKSKPELIGKLVKLKVFEEDPTFNDMVFERLFKIEHLNTLISFELTQELFAKGGNEPQEYLIFKLYIDDQLHLYRSS